MGSANEDPDGYEDPRIPPHAIHRERRRPHDWLAVGAFVASIVINVGSVAWWGGRLDQRVEILEKRDAVREAQIQQSGKDDARHDSAIAASNVAYADIIRRLDSIERKLDHR